MQLKITYRFKSLPIINKFYYQSKHDLFKNKGFNYLLTILSIIILIIINYYLVKSSNKIRIYLRNLKNQKESKIIDKITDQEIKKY